MPLRPSAEELKAARDKLLPDILAADLRILLVGINPGLYSAAVGHHFGRPGNRFWKVLALSGLTPRLYAPHEDHTLPSLGLGLTNLVPRTTARAEELARDELREGAERLSALSAEWRPRVVAILGVSAYRSAFSRPKAGLGLQSECVGEAALWVLPNPSGLNAHHPLPELAPHFSALRQFAFSR